MKLKVIKNAYYVSEDLTNIGMVDQATFYNSFSRLLVMGDVWESRIADDGDGDSFEYFECVEGEWLGETNDGWWDYESNEAYFEVIN
jgi:hypothetical protein